MTYLIATLFVVYAVSVLGLCWHLWRAVQLVRGQRALPLVADDAREWPSLDVVIPVKDEEANIAACLESVLIQDYPHARIFVVNDRSRDGTARVVQRIQDRYPQVRRVDIAELPEGAYGKPHAIHSIAGELTSDCIAFVDSDLRLERACLRTLVSHLTANNFDWMAVMGAPEVSLFWERLLVPLLGAVIFARHDPRQTSDPARPNAIGSALMVCRRESYQALGGHGAVIDVYDEDSELIRIAKRAGQKVSFVLTPELFRQRHYGTLSATIRGMTRTFVGGAKTVPRLLLTMNALSFVSLLPVTLLILLGLTAAFGWSPPWTPLWWLAGGLHLFVSTALAALVYHTAGRDRHLALLHPVGCAILIGVCIRAIVHLARGESIAWRGTRY
jgi:chlorobactene glucosyltransferase